MSPSTTLGAFPYISLNGERQTTPFFCDFRIVVRAHILPHIFFAFFLLLKIFS